MADAEDLKSSGDFSSCGFDSHPGHQTHFTSNKLGTSHFINRHECTGCATDLFHRVALGLLYGTPGFAVSFARQHAAFVGNFVEECGITTLVLASEAVTFSCSLSVLASPEGSVEATPSCAAALAGQTRRLSCEYRGADSAALVSRWLLSTVVQPNQTQL